MPEPKQLSRGEVIYKEDDPVDTVYLIQSGIVSISIERVGTTIEIGQAHAGELLGEEALWGATHWTATARANNDVELVPLQANAALALWKQALPLARALGQSLIEKHRRTSQGLREMKMEADPTPCPPGRVTKLFAVLYHVASYTGTPKKDKITVVWPAFKKYCQRVFLESPVRLEQATNILVKLGYAELEFVPCETDPEAPDELGFVHFKDLEVVKGFFEFHRKLRSRSERPEEIDPVHRAILQAIDEWNAKGKVFIEGAKVDGAA
jgi:CRP-like cAMP-binding protein